MANDDAMHRQCNQRQTSVPCITSATKGRRCCSALLVQAAVNDAALHPHECDAMLQVRSKLWLWLGLNQYLPKGVQSITHTATQQISTIAHPLHSKQPMQCNTNPCNNNKPCTATQQCNNQQPMHAKGAINNAIKPWLQLHA